MGPELQSLARACRRGRPLRLRPAACVGPRGARNSRPGVKLAQVPDGTGGMCSSREPLKRTGAGASPQYRPASSPPSRKQRRAAAGEHCRRLPSPSQAHGGPAAPIRTVAGPPFLLNCLPTAHLPRAKHAHKHRTRPVCAPAARAGRITSQGSHPASARAPGGSGHRRARALGPLAPRVRPPAHPRTRAPGRPPSTNTTAPYPLLPASARLPVRRAPRFCSGLGSLCPPAPHPLLPQQAVLCPRRGATRRRSRAPHPHFPAANTYAQPRRNRRCRPASRVDR